MTDALVQEFLDLTPEEKTARVARAKEKAEAGICFLCAWIIRKVRFEDFPREGRMKHLALCCAPSEVAP